MLFTRKIIPFALFLIVLACKKEAPSITPENIYKFNDYVSEVTSGIISTNSEIKIVLMQPVSDWTANIELDNSILKISPNVNGKVVVLNNRTLAFVPNERLEQDTRYRLKLDLGALQEVPKDFETFEFDVKTIKQDIHVSTNYLQSYSNDWQYIEGVIKSSDDISVVTAQKLVTAKQEGKPLHVKIVSNNPMGKHFKFIIDSVQRFENNSEVAISWDGEPFKIDSEGDYDFEIIGKNNFEVVGVNVVDGGNQKHIEVNFSDPLDLNQNLSGLVALQDMTLNFTIDGNVLKIYPESTPDGVYNLEIYRGIKSVDGYKIKQNVTKEVTFESFKPEVRLLQNGTILPTSEDLKFNFEAVALKAVDITVIKIYENNVLQFLQDNELNGDQDLKKVARPIAKKTIKLEDYSSKLNTWQAYSIDLKTIINPNPGAIYRVQISFKKSYSLFECHDNGNDDDIEEEADNYDTEDAETSYWDSDYYSEDYSWRDSDNPCSKSYYSNKKVSANILASNLGVTVKKGQDGSYFVAVSDLINTNPVANVSVVFYNYQQQVIGKQETNNDGQLTFDATSPVYFVVATKDKQSTYVKLKDGNVLSVSKFNVSGVSLKRGLKGFIYGERGVWRPGDTLFLSFMLNDKSNKLPKEHPVKLELFNPQGTVVYRHIETNGLNNLYHFKVPTSPDDPTGNWGAAIHVGGATFRKPIKIETIKPNRLKIKADINADLITSQQTIKGKLNVVWLHGAIAKNLSADTHIKLSQKHTTFKAFPSFEFNDPTRIFSQEQQLAFNGKTDENGNAVFSFKPELENLASGMLKASLITKVYENGGDFSTDVFSVDYSPFKSYVGISTPKGDAAKGMLLTDVKHRFDIATVNEQGKPIAVSDLEVKVFKVNQNWWWNESDSNLSSFDTSSSHNEIFSKNLSTNANGTGFFEFELKYPDWGRFLVYIINKESGHATGKTVFIDWPGWAGKARKGDPSAATMLSFSTNKSTYNVGETAIVTFPSSATGRALVTVETGTKVLKSIWVKAVKGDTKFELPITNDMTPNVYIHISLLQPHKNTKNDLPIRMYGVSGITVENPETKLSPQINMPDVLRPESKVTVKINEKNGKPMTYSIAVVDEGLLDLTRYKTPNPWEVFYKKQALGVKTWDIYDAVIGAFGGSINQVFSIGGDGAILMNKNKKANRFKPVVAYLGPFELGKNKTNSHSFNMPKYVGSVRTMVVAHNSDDEAYGQTEKATPVRTPLMVLASMPRKVTQGEKLRLPITIFALEEKIKKVSVSLKNNAIFKVIGKSSQTVNFTSPEEKMVYFDVEVAQSGLGTMEVIVAGHGEKASYSLEVDAVNPNPITTETIDIILSPNSSKTINFETFGVVGTNSAQLEASTFKSLNFNERMQYLIRYPHGCVEQTTSSVFPQLYLNDVFDLSADKKAEIQKNIRIGIDKLAKFQKNNGGFSYWQGETAVDDWATSYVGHFLLEAEKKGYVLPLNLKKNWISYQENVSKYWKKSSSATDLAQAYRLFTLALANASDMASMNRLRESKNLSNEAKIRLAGAYVLAANQKSVATSILNSLSENQVPEDDAYSSTYGSLNRNNAMALETYVLLNDTPQAKILSDQLAIALTDKSYMSTQTTAYSLLAIAKYAKLVGGKGVKIEYRNNGSKSKTISTNKSLATRELIVEKGKNKILLENKKDNLVYVTILNAGILPIGEEKVIQQNLLGNIIYKNEKGNTIEPSKIQQGTDFIAEISITNQTSNRIKDMALTCIFPSGWEIVNTRFTDFGSFAENKVTHEDIRDDRSNFYFDLTGLQTKKLRVLLNASYLGKYYLPGMQCEAMYDDSYMLRTKGQWIEVVK
ncbi:alpha-2-macroglobulin family protein [Tamlana sp. I1]|uniref:alpha-2-macroglobulin family protein n=1 Tax=Tamlana sp. I1 TaxID=2762061 RepID=UPI00188F7CB1|nr:MG2 domain-containing protein [Tamlana sp. I1]